MRHRTNDCILADLATGLQNDARQTDFQKLRSGGNQQIHAASNSVPVHRLNDVSVKGSSSGVEVKCLIPVNQANLSMRREYPVIGALRRNLRRAEKRSSIGLASIEMR